jgi:hypothetical protein
MTKPGCEGAIGRETPKRAYAVGCKAPPGTHADRPAGVAAAVERAHRRAQAFQPRPAEDEFALAALQKVLRVTSKPATWPGTASWAVGVARKA